MKFKNIREAAEKAELLRSRQLDRKHLDSVRAGNSRYTKASVAGINVAATPAVLEAISRALDDDIAQLKTDLLGLGCELD